MSSSRDVVLPNKTYFYFAFTLVVATMFLVQLYYQGLSGFRNGIYTDRESSVSH